MNFIELPKKPLPTMYIEETLVDQNGSFRNAFDM